MIKLTKWSEDWNVGHLDIDLRRKHLFRLWQLALDAMDDDRLKIIYAPEYVRDISKVMNSCFAVEEGRLASANCPFLEQHAQDHRVIADKIAKLIYRTRCHKDELHKALLEWTDRHVPEIDVLCSGCSKDTHNNSVCRRADLPPSRCPS